MRSSFSTLAESNKQTQLILLIHVDAKISLQTKVVLVGNAAKSETKSAKMM